MSKKVKSYYSIPHLAILSHKTIATETATATALTSDSLNLAEFSLAVSWQGQGPAGVDPAGVVRVRS
jgi:hypothetical protein